jgi:hypothetical protein
MQSDGNKQSKIKSTVKWVESILLRQYHRGEFTIDHSKSRDDTKYKLNHGVSAFHSILYAFITWKLGDGE